MLEDQRSKSPEEGGYIIEGILWLKHLHETTLKMCSCGLLKRGFCAKIMENSKEV